MGCAGIGRVPLLACPAVLHCADEAELVAPPNGLADDATIGNAAPDGVRMPCCAASGGNQRSQPDPSPAAGSVGTSIGKIGAEPDWF